MMRGELMNKEKKELIPCKFQCDLCDRRNECQIRCGCCYRHIYELKPFGGPGDPVVGDFTGQLLVKTYRCDFPEFKIPSKYSDCLTKEGTVDKQRLIEKFGREEYDELVGLSDSYDIVGSYWLCRDCILLEREEFHKKLRESYRDFLHKKGDYHLDEIDKIFRQAFIAWRKYCTRNGLGKEADALCCSLDERNYIVKLENFQGTLATYKYNVQTGKLSRIKTDELILHRRSIK